MNLFLIGIGNLKGEIEKKPDENDTYNLGNSHLGFDLADTTLSFDEYKKLLQSIDINELADSLFERYIVSGDEYRLDEMEKRPVAVKTAALGYPQAARALGVEGVVLVEFVLDTLGNVVPGSAKMVRAIPPGVFEGAAMQAIYHWRYTPAVDKSGRKIQTRWLQVLIFKAK